MNSKKLIISFVAVSIAALIVSSVAVFAVARTYSAALSRTPAEGEPEDIAPPEISASLPAETFHREDTALPETESDTQTVTEAEAAETSVAAETETETEIGTETESPETSGEVTAEVTERMCFTLCLAGGRLVIISPEGETVYERIIDLSDLRQNDRAALTAGIDLPDLAAAMSAVYDIIS